MRRSEKPTARWSADRLILMQRLEDLKKSLTKYPSVRKIRKRSYHI